MSDWEFDELGTKIQDIIEQAVSSQNYQKLNQSINQTVNKAIENGGEALKNVINNTVESCKNAEEMKKSRQDDRNRARQTGRVRYRQPDEVRKPELPANLYMRTTGIQLKGIGLTVGGGLLAMGTLTDFITIVIKSAIGIQPGAVSIVLFAMMAAGSAGCLWGGIRSLGLAGRFRKYLKTLGSRTYCNFDQLARASGKTLKFVKKDIRKMIHKGLFLEGHIDEQETCLITSNETYQQYVETQKQLEMKKRAENPRVDVSGVASPEVQEILDKGNEYLVKIRQSNDAIPGEEISAKISRMELLVQKIFERAKEHPEVIPDLKRLMNYYLPVTVKLLDAYEDMDRQPVQGENIRSSQKEIEDTLDTLNSAFEKLLDSVFKDVAWDVSSDISVLNTVLAQEGLKEDDFTRRK